ncbi:MAG: SpoIIE family protein phosphatase [Bacteroidota bacterium]
MQRESSDILPLFEFSNIVNSSLDLHFILSTVLRTLMGKMLVASGMVLLRNEEQTFEVISAKGLEVSALGKRFTIEKPIRAITTIDKIKATEPAWLSFVRQFAQSLLIPIVSRQKVVGFITLSERLKGKYSGTDKQLIQSLVNLSGSAIEKALIIEQVNEANRSLDRKYQELNTLFDLSKEFNVGLDVDKVVRLITFALLGQVGVKSYAICLRKNAGLEIVSSRLQENPGSLDALQELCELKKPERTPNLLRQKHFRLAGAELHKLGIDAVIPMHIQNQTKGGILLGPRLRGGEYSNPDLEFLYSLGNLAIISIENARLFQEALEKQRMEDELQIAREIQQGLLPESLPPIPGFEVAALNISSKQVGGDYYDIILRDNKEFVLGIGDVSGKGTPAALLMANVQAALRALAPLKTSLASTTARINDLTCANTRGGSKFITFFWGVLDAASREFRYVNAGHNPPVLLRASGLIEKLEKGGIILGIVKTSTPYEEGLVTLSHGDMLVLYTDGVSEAMNAAGEDFTEEKLEEVLNAGRTLSAQELIRHVQRALEAHTQGTPQSDDITLLVLKTL